MVNAPPKTSNDLISRTTKLQTLIEKNTEKTSHIRRGATDLKAEAKNLLLSIVPGVSTPKETSLAAVKITDITGKLSTLQKNLMRARRDVNILDQKHNVFETYRANHILTKCKQSFEKLKYELEMVRTLLNQCNYAMIKATKPRNLVPSQSNPYEIHWIRRVTLTEHPSLGPTSGRI